MAHGLAWKVQRLRSMSPAELGWRVGQRVALARLARRAGQPPPPLPLPGEGIRAAFESASAPLVPFTGTADGPAVFERAFPGATDRVVARAEAILEGRIELFARTFDLGGDPRAWPWNRDPAGGPEVPLGFGPTLDYRDPAEVGDARRAWELGRFGFLAPVAQAAWLTGDEDGRCARFVFAVLEAFAAACPPYRGIQWASALEYALRSLSWGFALALVARSAAGRTIEDARWERVLATWAEQLRFVAAHDARHSSANNHRLGEAAGLAWGGIALSFLPEAAAWTERGLAVLEESLLAQTTPDGVTREHAFAYQRFVLDFAVVVEAAAARTGRAIPVAVRERIAAVADTLDALSPGGVPWPVGDGDEGEAFPLGEPFEGRAAGSLEAALRLAGGTWRGARHPRASWLGLGESDGAAAPAPPRPARVSRGGYTVEAWPTPWGEARLLFDAAELGLAPLYAHGHADALMLLLDVGGPRLVDPGTGAYHAEPALREVLRATAAHNTLELDGASQSEPGGLFQWLRAARVIDRRDDEAAHDGYARAGAIHRRAWRREGDTRIVVVDRLEPAGGRAGAAGAVRHAAVRWHVGDGRARLLGPGRAEARWPDGFVLALEARLPDGGSARVRDDATWAPRFLEPRPCGVVEWILEGRLPLEVVTTIELGASTGSARMQPGT